MNMRLPLWWKSFRARLIFGAVIWIIAGVAVSGLILSNLFREHVVGQFDADLHGHAAELAALVDIDEQGRPYLRRGLSDPRFQPPGSGFYWQIERDNGQAAYSPSLRSYTLNPDGVIPPDGIERHSFVQGPTGMIRLVQRAVPVQGSGEKMRLSIGVDERMLDEVLARFDRTLTASLAVIALGLIAAAFAQVAFGLQPLGRVQKALAEVRSGRSRRLAGDLPSEVTPLVHDLNALIEANHEMIQRARAQAGNLAHALRTPLVILTDEGDRLLAEGQAEAGETILAQCERMRRQIDYHIARARAAASKTAPGAAAEVAAVVVPILAAMERLHGQKGVTFQFKGDLDVWAACDPQDLGEMLANLIDNGGKWARTTVKVHAAARDGSARVTVDDDGPGLPPESWEVVFDMGERLDAPTPGSGLGLTIVRDLASLYQGRAWLEAAPIGGVRAVLELPAVEKRQP